MTRAFASCSGLAAHLAAILDNSRLYELLHSHRRLRTWPALAKLSRAQLIELSECDQPVAHYHLYPQAERWRFFMRPSWLHESEARAYRALPKLTEGLDGLPQPHASQHWKAERVASAREVLEDEICYVPHLLWDIAGAEMMERREIVECLYSLSNGEGAEYPEVLCGVELPGDRDVLSEYEERLDVHCPERRWDVLPWVLKI